MYTGTSILPSAANNAEDRSELACQAELPWVAGNPSLWPRTKEWGMCLNKKTNHSCKWKEDEVWRRTGWCWFVPTMIVLRCVLLWLFSCHWISRSPFLIRRSDYYYPIRTEKAGGSRSIRHCTFPFLCKPVHTCLIKFKKGLVAALRISCVNSLEPYSTLAREHSLDMVFH